VAADFSVHRQAAQIDVNQSYRRTRAWSCVPSNRAFLGGLCDDARLLSP